MKSAKILGQKSYEIGSDKVHAWVTETGGHVAPVSFRIGDRSVEPFSVAPWAEEHHGIAPILQVLRGDFFCMPFGGNDAPYGDEQYPIHGETANANWSVTRHDDHSIEMELITKVRPGYVAKHIWTEPGQSVIYQRHVVSGMEGPMCIGQHAMVKFKSVGQISLSPFEFGQVFPDEFESPKLGGYTSLKPGARFTDLNSVPANDGSLADLSSYPAREGFEDLVMVYAQRDTDFAWTAVTFPDEEYIWFSLRDPRILTGTILWHSNGGRHYMPWSSRHRAVLGLEEVTSYMHYGLAGSVADNVAQREGFRTYFDLNPEHVLAVNSIIGVVGCSSDSGPVTAIERTENGIQISTVRGEPIDVQLNVEELYRS